MTKPKFRYIMHWETIGVTALPAGWRNVFREDDGTFHLSHCPALLFQEHRESNKCWDVVGEDGRPTVRVEKIRESEPYETRVVFAEADGPTLGPVDDLGNYDRTIGPGEELADQGNG